MGCTVCEESGSDGGEWALISIAEQLHGKLIVSCQAWPGDPLDDTDAIRRMALAALRGGAAGLRINSPEHIATIRKETAVPIIGLQKHFQDGVYRITPDFASARLLAEAGASMIALDCTPRNWTAGEAWQQMIRQIHAQLHLPVMADVATLEEAIAAERVGADFVGPTLHGYTDSTRGADSFNFDLLAQMARQVSVPIIAEGHIATPADARKALDNGAWCVVVGSAITRPREITAGFVRALKAEDASRIAIGVDLGGTSVKAALVRGDGTIAVTAQTATRAAEGRDAVVAGLADVIEQVMAQARKLNVVPRGLGIASAGAINPNDGTVFAATDNLPDWAGFNLRQAVEDRFHLPTLVINDAQAAAFAELHYGVGRNLNDFVAITIGTGVGGGMVCGGKLQQGQHGLAGTVGHQTIRVDGRPCNCGRKGCLEAYVSTAALIRAYRQYGGQAEAGEESLAAQARRISSLALAGNAAASCAYAEMGEYLAEGIANLFNLLDPQAVVLSGGLVEGHAVFVDKVERRVRDMLHFGRKRMPSVLLARVGCHAGMQGAAALVFEKLDP